MSCIIYKYLKNIFLLLNNYYLAILKFKDIVYLRSIYLITIISL